MIHSTPVINGSYKKGTISIALLTAILVLSLIGTAQANDSDKTKVISSWRSDGTLYSMSDEMKFYAGFMKGTFFVKHNTGKAHYTHAALMNCPFSVQISKGQKGVLQGMCKLGSGDNTANAKISCTGEKENCLGKWVFTSGTGNFKGIQGESPMKIRVDLIQDKSTNNETSSLGRKTGSSGYLVIKNLRDNVDGSQGTPRVN